MKVEIISNGKTRIFLSPETSMDEAALADLGKQPVEFIVINKQVSILDKTFSSGVILQTKVRDTNEPSSFSELGAKAFNDSKKSPSSHESLGSGVGMQTGATPINE
jgi:hypothetical protein